MHFAFSEDQDELRAAVRALLERHAAPAHVRALLDDPAGHAPDTWRVLVEQMELTGLAVDEERGGTGASFVEVGIVLEELGRTLLPTPYLPTVVAAVVLRDGGADELLARIVAGASAALAVAAGGAVPVARATGDGLEVDGVLDHVLHGDIAEVLVVPAQLDGGQVRVAVDAGAATVTREALPTLDQTRRQARVRLSGARAQRLAAPVDRARDLLWVALAAESVGAARACLDLTVAYLKDRRQFDRPLSSFQALRHRCADLAAELEAATSTAYYAMWVVDGAPAELPVVAPLAKAVCSQAFLHMAAETIQLHGGIGFTWEHDAHLYFKRAKSTELLYGAPHELRRLVGERAGVI
jgi:alkylation response protein AidB-like acyl-CoA dehydrogenase